MIPVVVEAHEEGGYLAVCVEIQGCHAEGDTMDEAVANIAEVAEMIWQLCAEKNISMPGLLKDFGPGVRIEARIVPV